MVDRSLEAGDLARALRISPDSVGRYAREGRIPFDVTPGGHRRFNVDEVKLALGAADGPAGAHVFSVPAATLRARAIRSVTTSRSAASAVAAPAATERDSAVEQLLCSAWRVQRSVPLATT